MKWFKTLKQGSHEKDEINNGSQELNQVDDDLDNSWEPSQDGIIAELRYNVFNIYCHGSVEICFVIAIHKICYQYQKHL